MKSPNPMEELYLRSNDLLNVINYYNVATKKVKKDINKIFNTITPSEKEYKRLLLYSFRYKMIKQSLAGTTDARLNKLYRPNLTIPSKDFN